MNKERWHQLTLPQQLGNIGSELNRARNAQNIKDFDGRNKALSRALELIDLTLQDIHRASAFKELARLREVVSVQFVGKQTYQISLKELINYCVSFTIMPHS